MNDIAANLRRTRADMLGTNDEEHYWHCQEAADELERLYALLEREQSTVLMLRNALQALRGKFLPGSFEQKMIDDALKCSEALQEGE